MADSFVQLNNDGPGKKIDTRTEATNGDHRQVMVIGDPTTNANVANVTASGGVQVDGSGVTQPVSAASLPLPTGAATSVNQSSAQSTLTTISNNTPPVGQATMANSSPVVIASNQSAISTTISGALPAGTNVIGHIINDSGSTTVVTGNVTVVQPTGTNLHAVIDSGSITTVPPANASTNLTQVAGVTLGATAVTTYGTAPASANVPGVNAFITNTPAVTLTSTTITGLVNTQGDESNNTAAPDATMLGVLPAQANAASPAWTEGNNVVLSVDLTGRQRFRGTLTHNNAAPSSDGQMALTEIANAVAPTYTEGNLALGSVDLSGNRRVIGTKTNNNAAPTTQMGVISALANAAAPSWTEGNQVLLSEDLSGNLRVKGASDVAQASTTAGQLGNLVMGAVTTGAPTYTTGQTDPLSLNTSGALRIVGETTLGISPANTDNKVVVMIPVSDNGVLAATWVADALYGGAFSGTASAAKQGLSLARTPTVFKTVSVAATATGNTAVWTPGAGNKFRLLGYQITAQGLSATASAAVTVSFQDAAVAVGYGTYDVDVPAVANVVSGVNQISGGPVAMGSFGILSAAANNVLNFNISAAGTGTTGTYRVNVYGVEE